MPDMKLPSYFYGDEAMQFTYFRIPCQLITHPRFKHLSTDSKLLYGMLLDRMSLSIKNEWYDDTGRVYIYYTVDEMACLRTPGASQRRTFTPLNGSRPSFGGNTMVLIKRVYPRAKRVIGGNRRLKLKLLLSIKSLGGEHLRCSVFSILW